MYGFMRFLRFLFYLVSINSLLFIVVGVKKVYETRSLNACTDKGSEHFFRVEFLINNQFYYLYTPKSSRHNSHFTFRNFFLNIFSNYINLELFNILIIEFITLNFFIINDKELLNASVQQKRYSKIQNPIICSNLK